MDLLSIFTKKILTTPPRSPLSMIFGGNKTSEQISNFWKTNMKTNENKTISKTTTTAANTMPDQSESAQQV